MEAIVEYFPPQGSHIGYAWLLLAADDDRTSSAVTGVMLFRAAVPEPPTGMLMLLGVAGLIIVQYPSARGAIIITAGLLAALSCGKGTKS
jgi:hypothetical protein